MEARDERPERTGGPGGLGGLGEPGGPVGDAVGQSFRRSAARMTASLARVFGDLGLAEDVVSEAMLRALQVWSWRGIPDDPDAWLARVARNRALDAIRRQRLARRKEDEVRAWAERAARGSAGEGEDDEEVRDDLLRVILAACHPVLSAESRVALTLKSACGFGVGEIARALLSTPEAVEQRVTRAKARLKAEGESLEVPGPAELSSRLESVLEVIYLVFNEGWSAHGGDALVRAELLTEAFRLCRLLLDLRATAEPRVEALYALMLFTGARLDARVGPCGDPLTLAEQDRARWNRDWLAAGFVHFDRSLRGERLSPWHVEAAIASCHAAASSYEDTDWCTILERYDQLLRFGENPVVRLNRAVAVAKVKGLDAALAELDRLEGEPALARYYLLPATRGQLLWAAGRFAEGAAAFRAAAELHTSAPEREFLLRRAAQCARGDPARF